MKDSEYIRPDNIDLYCNTNGHLLKDALSAASSRQTGGYPVLYHL